MLARKHRNLSVYDLRMAAQIVTAVGSEASNLYRASGFHGSGF